MTGETAVATPTPNTRTKKGIETVRTWNKWIRRVHRWLVMPFVLAIIYLLTGFALNGESFVLPSWLNIIAIGSLIALLLTGLYMFGHYYWLQWRRAR